MQRISSTLENIETYKKFQKIEEFIEKVVLTKIHDFSANSNFCIIYIGCKYIYYFLAYFQLLIHHNII